MFGRSVSAKLEWQEGSEYGHKSVRDFRENQEHEIEVSLRDTQPTSTISLVQKAALD